MKVSVIDLFIPYELCCGKEFGVFYGEDAYYTFYIDVPLKQIFICCYDYDVGYDYCMAINIQYSSSEFEKVLDALGDSVFNEENIFFFSEDAVERTINKYTEGAF